jgi:hypothetical protein
VVRFWSRASFWPGRAFKRDIEYRLASIFAKNAVNARVTFITSKLFVDSMSISFYFIHNNIVSIV